MEPSGQNEAAGHGVPAKSDAPVELQTYPSGHAMHAESSDAPGSPPKRPAGHGDGASLPSGQ